MLRPLAGDANSRADHERLAADAIRKCTEKPDIFPLHDVENHATAHMAQLRNTRLIKTSQPAGTTGEKLI